MLPNVSFLGLDLYWWMVIVGVIAAMVAFRLFHEEAGISVKVFNFSLFVAVFGIVLGYLAAVLFQSWYSFLDTGEFKWGVGATFYGGLIGAVIVFLSIYFGVGHFIFKDKLHIKEFNNMLSLIMPCIVIAHGFGRIGCLFDGCCYGDLTNSWIGINMYSGGAWGKRIPVQLFESFFLFALFGVLIYLLVRKKCEYTTSIYLIVYGIWRFAIEFARTDERGSSGISFLTPSQLTAIIMVLFGIGFIFLYKYVLKNFYARAGANAALDAGANGGADTGANEEN